MGVNASGTHPRQYLFSRGRNILYPPKFVIVVFIIVNSMLTVHIIWLMQKCIKMHRFARYNSKFFKGLCPEPRCWGGATASLCKPHPPWHFGAACLPRIARGFNRPPMFVSHWHHGSKCNQVTRQESERHLQKTRQTEKKPNLLKLQPGLGDFCKYSQETDRANSAAPRAQRM